jgi:putative PEP-CTERM system histidine kinase
VGHLGALGYGLAALAYLSLAWLLVVGWEGRGQGLRLIVAALVTSAWAALLAYLAAGDLRPAVPLFLAGTVKHAAWLVVLAGLVQSGGFPLAFTRLAYAAWVAVLATGIAVLAFRPAWFTATSMTAGVLLPLIGLVLLEQVYRNANSGGRWALRFLYIGLGGMLLYDVFLFAQGLLVGAIDEDVWLAQGYVVALSVPPLALAARRNPAWSVRVFVSRDVTFYTTSLIALGGYLLAMAVGGYVVGALGGSWGHIAQIVFLFGALGLLAVLVGSTALRRRLKVFLVKHFYRHKYEYREEWLRFIATLSGPGAGDDPRRTSLRAVAQIIGSPGAALLMTSDRRDVFDVAAVWPDATSTLAPSASLGQEPQLLDFLGRRRWVIDLDEYRRDPDAYEQLALPTWLVSDREWRLLVPVLLGDTLLGTMLMKAPPQGFDLTFEDRDLLTTTARHVATHLAQYESERRLAEVRQFEAYSRLTAFLMHDLKNTVAQLQLVVSNAGRHRHKPEFVADAIDTVDSAARRIGRLIEQLGRGNVQQSLEAVPVRELAAAAVENTGGREPRPALEVEDDRLEVLASRDRLVSILEHVIRNAQEATTPAGQVIVRIRARPDKAVIEVADTGQGMSPEFVQERLFRPFDSTKGSKGMGIGAFQAREYARSLGGDVEVDSVVGRGTTFRIIIPLTGAVATD